MLLSQLPKGPRTQHVRTLVLKSTPLKDTWTLWVWQRIAHAFAQERLGGACFPCGSHGIPGVRTPSWSKLLVYSLVTSSPLIKALYDYMIPILSPDWIRSFLDHDSHGC